LEHATESPAKDTVKAAPASRTSALRTGFEQNPLLQLQQQAGNQAVQELLRSGAIRAKLSISMPDDPEEREADQVAQTIMRSSEPSSVPASSRAVNEPILNFPSILRSHSGFAPSACSCGTGEEMCEECKQKQSPTIQRNASALAAPVHVPRIVGDVLSSPGHALDASTRAFFEPRFGQDFSQVRVHTNPAAAASARSIQANAYTAGSDIVFAQGQYSPNSMSGRTLIAHELTHVLQQHVATGTSSSLVRNPVRSGVQRQADPAAPPSPTEITDSKKEEGVWRSRVDHAVRSLFDLRGPGLTAANVQFLEQKQFGQAFTGAELEDKLFTIFLNNFKSGEPGLILATNNEPIAIAGITPSTIESLHNFVKAGIAKGTFHGQSGEHLVNTGPFDPNAPIRLVPGIDRTPQELVSMYIAGLTDISGSPATRSIKMRVAGGTFQVDTLSHETCHFYVSPAFRNMATGRSDGQEFLGSARISQILLEGFAEYFNREVMRANAATFGPPANDYPAEVEQVGRIVSTLGEASVRAAYFGGIAQQVNRVSVAVDEYKDAPDDWLVPGFVVDVRIQKAAPSTPAIKRSAISPTAIPTIQRSASEPTRPLGIVHDVLRAPGHPLDSSTRAFFEPRFGRDFSQVRVHTGPEASASAQSISANAYAAGSDIVFAHGQYSPNCTSGRALIAHELTHTIQSAKNTSLAEPRISRQDNPSAPPPPPKVDTQAVKDAVDIITKALKGITTASDSQKILQQFQGKGAEFIRAIMRELKSRAADYDETPDGMVHWLFKDMTAEDRGRLRALLMNNHVLEDLGPILIEELNDALSSWTDHSSEVMEILTALGGPDLDAILSRLETAAKKSDIAIALYLFGEIDRVSADKLRTHFIQHGGKRSWYYVAYFTASKVQKLISGLLGIVSHSESTMVVDNFNALEDPSLRQLTQQELDKLTKTSDGKSAEDRLMQKLDQSDYEKLQRLPGLTLRAFDRPVTTTDKIASGAKWGLMLAEWTTCGVIGIATGLLAAVWDILKGIWDIVVAIKHLLGSLLYLVSGFSIGSEDWLAVKNFFLGIGKIFKDPGSLWDQLSGQLKAEFLTIEGPLADCKRAEFVVRKFIGVVVNILLIFLAGYGLLKAGVSAAVEFAELAEEIGVIRALGQTAAKAGRAIVKFVPAKAGEVAEVAKALMNPVGTLLKIRKQLNGILLAVDNEGVYAALRKRATGLLENERDFWKENKDAWQKKGLQAQSKQIEIEGEAGTVQNALDTEQVPDNGTAAIKDIENQANTLDTEAKALEDEMKGDPDSKKTGPESKAKPADLGEDQIAEPLEKGDARVSKEGHCKICHSPCQLHLDMAREVLDSVRGTRFQGYAENLLKRIQLLDDAMVESTGRNAMAAEYPQRFSGAFRKLSSEIEIANRRFVGGETNLKLPAADEIESFGSNEPGGVLDDPDRFDYTKQVERAERAAEGTAFHNRIEDAAVASLPPDSVFTENTVQEFLAKKGVDPAHIPGKSQGIDLYVIDNPRKLVTPVDITGVSGGKTHVAKLNADVAKVRAAFEQAGFHMAEPIEIEYVGNTFEEASASVVVELKAYAR
jgi:hypothetical protein